MTIALEHSTDALRFVLLVTNSYRRMSARSSHGHFVKVDPFLLHFLRERFHLSWGTKRRIVHMNIAPATGNLLHRPLEARFEVAAQGVHHARSMAVRRRAAKEGRTAQPLPPVEYVTHGRRLHKISRTSRRRLQHNPTVEGAKIEPGKIGVLLPMPDVMCAGGIEPGITLGALDGCILRQTIEDGLSARSASGSSSRTFFWKMGNVHVHVVWQGGYSYLVDPAYEAEGVEA